MYRLAHEWGIPRPEEQLLPALTSRDVSKWAAYDRLYGIGAERLLLVMANAAAELWNTQRGTAGTPSRSANDFLPEPEDVEWQTHEQIIATIRSAKGLLRGDSR